MGLEQCDAEDADKACRFRSFFGGFVILLPGLVSPQVDGTPARAEWSWTLLEQAARILSCGFSCRVELLEDTVSEK